MSGYRNFAVAGVGSIGQYIIEALIEKKAGGEIASVSLLSRSSGGHDDLVAKGVKHVTVDYASSTSLESALSGIDVVISTISRTAIGVQDGLAASAKAVGVKLFVPSEFGNNSDGSSDPLIMQKEVLKRKLKELELPYACFYTGAFTDTVFAPGLANSFGFDLINGKITIPGSGTATNSWTTRADIGQFVAHALTALPKEKIEWRIFRIEGERTSFNQIAADWEAHLGKKLVISHRPRSEFEEAVAKNPRDLISNVILHFDVGGLVVGEPEEVSNDEFPDWKPKKVIDVLVEIYGQ